MPTVLSQRAGAVGIFFKPQNPRVARNVQKVLPAAFQDAEAVVFAVRHQAYLQLDPDQVVQDCGGPVAIIDAFGVLEDEKIRRYLELGCEVKALGRGHVGRIKEQIANSKQQE